MSGANSQHPASYRDPAGFIFHYNHEVYRAVQPVYQRHYDRLMTGGLYKELTEKQLFIIHEEVSGIPGYEAAYKLLKPREVLFWTYPYEWSFEQLKDAALLTLQVAKKGLVHDMILKDANAYNIQFIHGKPILIDSLSFECYEEGEAWQAFRQFCMHFLYPLLLMSKVPGISPSIFLSYLDGIPAKTVAGILPWRSRFNVNYQLYVYLQASSLAGRKATGALKISKQKIVQNLEQLTGFIKKLRPFSDRTVWNNYYQETILSNEYLQHKTEIVRDLINDLKPKRVTDIGCNTGTFSLLAAAHASKVIALDFDPGTIDAFYRTIRQNKTTNIHPIVADLTNPSPSMGWANAERKALPERLSCDMCMALAVVHHLALTNNLPLSFISKFFAGITNEWLLIEFIPKADPKAQILLENKKDIFPEYTQTHFEAAFQAYFRIEKTILLNDSARILYLLKKLS